MFLKWPILILDDGRFISQDCRHLTKAGGQYFVKLIDWNGLKILNISLSINYSKSLIWIIANHIFGDYSLDLFLKEYIL